MAALVEQFQATRVGELGGAPYWVYLIDNSDRHMALAVRVDKVDAPGDGQRASSWTYKGFRYWVAETTGTGWSIGELPQSLAEGARLVAPNSWREPRRTVAVVPRATVTGGFPGFYQIEP